MVILQIKYKVKLVFETTVFSLWLFLVGSFHTNNNWIMMDYSAAFKSTFKSTNSKAVSGDKDSFRVCDELHGNFDGLCLRLRIYDVFKEVRVHFFIAGSFTTDFTLFTSLFKKS